MYGRCKKYFTIDEFSPEFLQRSLLSNKKSIEFPSFKVMVGTIETEWSIIVYPSVQRPENYFSVCLKRLAVPAQNETAIEVSGEVTVRKWISLCFCKPLIRTEILQSTNIYSVGSISHDELLRLCGTKPKKLRFSVSFTLSAPRPSLYSGQRISFTTSGKCICD